MARPSCATWKERSTRWCLIRCGILGAPSAPAGGVGSLKVNHLPHYKDPTALALMRSIKGALDPMEPAQPRKGCDGSPRAACGVTPLRGRCQWPGGAGSTASWVGLPLTALVFFSLAAELAQQALQVGGEGLRVEQRAAPRGFAQVAPQHPQVVPPCPRGPAPARPPGPRTASSLCATQSPSPTFSSSACPWRPSMPGVASVSVGTPIQIASAVVVPPG